MNKTDALRFLKKIAAAAPKVLFLYVLAPCVLLLLLAEPIRSAALRSDLAACLLPFAALAAVGLNGAVYARLHRKAPPLLVSAWGMLWPLIVVILEYEAFPPVYPRAGSAGASFWRSRARSDSPRRRAAGANA